MGRLRASAEKSAVKYYSHVLLSLSIVLIQYIGNQQHRKLTTSNKKLNFLVFLGCCFTNALM